MAEQAAHGSLAAFIDELQASGRYTFDREEALKALGTSRLGLKKAVMRLSAKGRLVAPRRGFYLVVPIEYRSAGAPPPSWFVDDLMEYLGTPYYVGVLSAAALHGAAHQQPQEFQVVVPAAARTIVAGRARIRLLGKRNLAGTPTVRINTETGAMRASTPEATAMDLLRYVHAAGGLSNVAMVLSELAERIDPQRLAETAEAVHERGYAQRLGYLLEKVGAGHRVLQLSRYLESRRLRTVPLRPGKPVEGCEVDRRWRVFVNEPVETDQ